MLRPVGRARRVYYSARTKFTSVLPEPTCPATPIPADPSLGQSGRTSIATRIVRRRLEVPLRLLLPAFILLLGNGWLAMRGWRGGGG